MIVCFQSTNSAAGRRYGHAFLIHAIMDGIVYYSESSSVSIAGKYFPEGSAIAVTLEEFCQYYSRWNDYEGLIYFGRKTYADECSFFTSNLYVSVNETIGLYSSPCASEVDPRSKYRYDVKAGEKVHVVGLYRNTEGEYWYELDDGHNGFIPADKTTLISCFDKDGITTYTAPETLTGVQDGAFSNCTKLQSVVLPDDLTGIPWQCFADCTALTEVTIPVTVEYINDDAFANCRKLETIWYDGTEEQWTSNIFIGNNNDCNIHR
jgi:hypothetical protein